MPHRPRLVVSRSTCPPPSPAPQREQCYNRYCSNKHTHTPGREREREELAERQREARERERTLSRTIHIWGPGRRPRTDSDRITTLRSAYPHTLDGVAIDHLLRRGRRAKTFPRWRRLCPDGQVAIDTSTRPHLSCRRITSRRSCAVISGTRRLAGNACAHPVRAPPPPVASASLKLILAQGGEHPQAHRCIVTFFRPCKFLLCCMSADAASLPGRRSKPIRDPPRPRGT